MKTKKGDLSINVIIVAAIALIILVVLVVIFTGRIGVFSQGVSKEGNAQLVKMQITYGDCRPTTAAQNAFTTAYDAAGKDVNGQNNAISQFESQIASCKSNTDKSSCEGSGCKWN
jgi:hypothetical protein